VSLIRSRCTGKADEFDELDPERDGGGVSSSADSIGILGDFKETFLYHLPI
jgi:hypothetical protein